MLVTAKIPAGRVTRDPTCEKDFTMLPIHSELDSIRFYDSIHSFRRVMVMCPYLLVGGARGAGGRGRPGGGGGRGVGFAASSNGAFRFLVPSLSNFPDT